MKVEITEEIARNIIGDGHMTDVREIGYYVSYKWNFDGDFSTVKGVPLYAKVELREGESSDRLGFRQIGVEIAYPARKYFLEAKDAYAEAERDISSALGGNIDHLKRTLTRYRQELSQFVSDWDRCYDVSKPEVRIIGDRLNPKDGWKIYWNSLKERCDWITAYVYAFDRGRIYFLGEDENEQKGKYMRLTYRGRVHVQIPTKYKVRPANSRLFRDTVERFFIKYGYAIDEQGFTVWNNEYDKNPAGATRGNRAPEQGKRRAKKTRRY